MASMPEYDPVLKLDIVVGTDETDRWYNSNHIGNDGLFCGTAINLGETDKSDNGVVSRETGLDPEAAYWDKLDRRDEILFGDMYDPSYELDGCEDYDEYDEWV